MDEERQQWMPLMDEEGIPCLHGIFSLKKNINQIISQMCGNL